MAETLNTPPALSQPIAQNGDKNTIPVTNDQSLGLMSQSTGFPIICSQRIADGGKAPRRADFNGAFNLLSQQHYFFQNGGTETFRQEVSDAIGGYPLNARLWYLNENGESYILRSTKANNTDNFLTNPSVIGDSWVYDVSTTSYVNSKINEIRTNCITEIPQDIKLELNNGTLTLKAGSKVYVPNGKNSDGSNKFDVVTVESDKTHGSWGTITASNVYVGLLTNGNLWVGDNNAVAYNTTDNIILQVGINQSSFPIALVTFNNGVVTSIDQVFNGFGYIVSTVFALPGVKGLIPNGRNADGSLKNIEYNRTTVRVDTFDLKTYTGPFNLYSFQSYNSFQSIQNYDEKTNTMVGNYAGSFISGVGYLTNGVITSFTPKTPFHAVDYSDFKHQLDKKANVELDNVIPSQYFKQQSVGWVMPNYSAGVSLAFNTDIYIIQNGFIVYEFLGGSGGGNLTISINGVNVYLVRANYDNKHSGVVPIAKGSTFKATGSNVSVHNFTFYPCLGG